MMLCKLYVQERLLKSLREKNRDSGFRSGFGMNILHIIYIRTISLSIEIIGSIITSYTLHGLVLVPTPLGPEGRRGALGDQYRVGAVSLTQGNHPILWNLIDPYIRYRWHPGYKLPSPKNGVRPSWNTTKLRTKQSLSLLFRKKGKTWPSKF